MLVEGVGAVRWGILFALFILLLGCAESKRSKPSAEIDSPGLCSHNVIITYRVYYEKPTVSVRVEFSVDGGVTWRGCTSGVGGEPTENLSASPNGTEHTFAWDSLADIQGVSINTLIRVVPVGESVGDPAVAGPFIVNNSTNKEPQVMLLETLKAGGNLIIKYIAYDEDGDALKSEIRFDCGVGSWLRGTQNETAGGDPPSQLSSALQEENDESDQLSYWSLRNITLGTHTDSEGYVYVKLYEDPANTYNLELYSDSAMTNLIASTTTTTPQGYLSFTDANTGASVEVYLNYLGGDDDIKLRCGNVHYAVWNSLQDLGRVFVPNLKIKIEIADSQLSGRCLNELTVNLDNTGDVLELGSAATVNIGTSAAVATDLDGDLKDEIIAGCASDVALVDFTNPPTYNWCSLNTQIDTLAVGDLNNDSKPDIVVAGPDGEWLSTDAGNNWQLLQADTHTNSLIICDFNNDGYPEIVSARKSGLHLWLNSSGNLSLASSLISDKEFVSLVAADFNGDGAPDIYACSPQGDALFLKDTTGSIISFIQVTLPEGVASNCGTAFDLNADGNADILLGKNGQNIVLLNDGTGSFRKSENLPNQQENTLALTTITIRSKVYTVLANRGQNRLWVLWDGRFFDATPLNLPEKNNLTLCVTSGDFNGDGIPDLFFGNLNEDLFLVGR